MFGSFVSAREEGGGSAANMWQALRDSASAWAASTLNIISPNTPTQDEINAAAHELIGNVTIQDVNKYTALAGQYLSARANLAAQGLEQEIMGTSIFVPPWSTTAGNPAVPDRYRIRVLRDITVAGFTKIDRQEWATYELAGQLTTAGDALDYANTLFEQSDYNARASINNVVSYSIEQI
jgi:hypothetical protein